LNLNKRNTFTNKRISYALKYDSDITDKGINEMVYEIIWVKRLGD
jgi:hypothetical protein